eukprot:4566196-Pyramimonas_sp.AAC.1
MYYTSWPSDDFACYIVPECARSPECLPGTGRALRCAAFARSECKIDLKTTNWECTRLAENAAA